MTYTTIPTRAASRAAPFAPDRRHRADFARQATIAAFGWRYARFLDQGDFLDRLPGEMPAAAPEARFR